MHAYRQDPRPRVAQIRPRIPIQEYVKLKRPDLTRHLSYFSPKPQYFSKTKRHISNNQQHYTFLSLSITLGLLAALALTLTKIK